MKLWIDDVRIPPQGENWIWITNSLNAKQIINCCIHHITEISFDHDLGGDDTTIPVINFLENLIQTSKPPFDVQKIKLYVHSMNPVGRKNLQAAIESIERYYEVKHAR